MLELKPQIEAGPGESAVGGCQRAVALIGGDIDAPAALDAVDQLGVMLVVRIGRSHDRREGVGEASQRAGRIKPRTIATKCAEYCMALPSKRSFCGFGRH